MSAQVSSLTALCTTALLTSPALSRLIQLNSERLLDCYRHLTEFLDSRGIEYIPATAGLFVFARLMPTAKSWDDEASLQQCLRREGVLVSPGRLYHLPSEQNGWFRLTFAIPKDQLTKAVAILARCL
jgi:aspartate/methionine/tyrosine aminotransferase